MALFAEGSFFASATDTSSNVASLSSTPPTTVADSDSLHSDASKHDAMAIVDEHQASYDASAALHAPTPTLDSPMLDAGRISDAVAHVAAMEASPLDAPISQESNANGNTIIDSIAVVSAPSPRRARRARVSAPVYNLSQLSGTDGHGKRRANGDEVSDRRRRTISGDTLVGSIEVATGGSAAGNKSGGKTSGKTAGRATNASNPRRSLNVQDSPRTRRQAAQEASLRSPRTSSRHSGQAPVSTIASKFAKIKNGRKAADKAAPKVSLELKRLQDTKEFSHIDDRPVLHTIWSNGKFVDPNEPTPPPRKKAKVQTPEPEKEPEPITNTKKRRVKKYLGRGLYAGQEPPTDIAKGLTTAEKKKLAQLPELQSSGRINKTMPAPLYTGLRILLAGRDFKLPFQVCNPLPPGQPKPDEWKKMTKNRFIGDSKDYWRKTPHLLDQSTCVCKPEDGCGDDCQNRIMLYECDKINCNIGAERCTNRAFADLTARRAKGGKYRVGVEVIKTSDRGYGVRSNRCFEPNQIIMEYAGEIITEKECERRMNEVYKDNECYYLMSFDQNMIIDATTGSIARFVNHSCNPNCRMIKWIVSGKPRMALFAGDKPILTGDELTYDYNFDPFSAKNVQSCLCNEPNCRGVLGPRPREVKVAKTGIKKAVKATVKAGKRKLKELIGDDQDEGPGKSKKRKIQPAKGVKRSLSHTSLKAAKGAATALKKGVSTITVNAKKAALGTKASINGRASAGTVVKKTAKRIAKVPGKGVSKAKLVSSRNSSLTIVARSDAGSKAKKGSTKKTTLVKKAPIKKVSVKKAPVKKAPVKKTPGKKSPIKKPIVAKRASPLSKGPRKSSAAQKSPLKA